MPNSLADPRVDTVLSRLFTQADRDDEVASSLPQDRAHAAERAVAARLGFRRRVHNSTRARFLGMAYIQVGSRGPDERDTPRGGPDEAS